MFLLWKLKYLLAFINRTEISRKQASSYHTRPSSTSRTDYGVSISKPERLRLLASVSVMKSPVYQNAHHPKKAARSRYRLYVSSGAFVFLWLLLPGPTAASTAIQNTVLFSSAFKFWAAPSRLAIPDVLAVALLAFCSSISISRDVNGGPSCRHAVFYY